VVVGVTRSASWVTRTPPRGCGRSRSCARVSCTTSGARSTSLFADRAEIRAPASVRRIEALARVVVGPDEPVEGDSQEDAEAAYWTWMADLLGRQGVEADPSVLKQLPHDVTFSDKVRARFGPEPDAA